MTHSINEQPAWNEYKGGLPDVRTRAKQDMSDVTKSDLQAAHVVVTVSVAGRVLTASGKADVSDARLLALAVAKVTAEVGSQLFPTLSWQPSADIAGWKDGDEGVSGR